MAHTMDEIIAEQVTQKTAIDELAVVVQALKDKITAMPVIPADVQAKIDQAFDTTVANTAAIKAVAEQSSAQI